MRKTLLVVGLALECTACSSIIDGTSQQITLNTNPVGASCSLLRNDQVIARIDPTPGSAKIQKTKDDITVICDKEGYQEASYLNHSGIDNITFANIALGGGIGWAVDSSLGADNQYDGVVNLTLNPVYGAVPQPAQTPQAPSYQTPAYQTPAYQTPAYQTPAYQAPVAQSPAYQAPAYQARPRAPQPRPLPRSSQYQPYSAPETVPDGPRPIPPGPADIPADTNP